MDAHFHYIFSTFQPAINTQPYQCRLMIEIACYVYGCAVAIRRIKFTAVYGQCGTAFEKQKKPRIKRGFSDQAEKTA